jgi:hypothetical protein
MFNLRQYRLSQADVDKKYSPYAVIYTGQALEWYGNEEMTEGRYKNKGQGGKILAINIPTGEMANRVAEEMRVKLFEPRNLVGTGINGKKGRDWFITDFDRVFFCHMNELNEYFGIENEGDIKANAHPRLFVDYKGIEETPVKDEEIDTKGKEILELMGGTVGLVKSAGFMADEYKNFIKVHPEMVKELTVDQREKLRRSDDMDEIIEILEEAHNVRIRD